MVFPHYTSSIARGGAKVHGFGDTVAQERERLAIQRQRMPETYSRSPYEQQDTPIRDLIREHREEGARYYKAKKEAFEAMHNDNTTITTHTQWVNFKQFLENEEDINQHKITKQKVTNHLKRP